MFEKMIVSSANTGERRIARYLIAAFGFYVLAMAAALSLSVVLADPQLSRGTSGATRLFVDAPAPRLGGPAAPHPGIRIQPNTADYRHVEPLNRLLDRLSDVPVMPVRPPNPGDFNIGPSSGGNGGPPGSGAGSGDGSPGLLPVSPSAITPPPRPAARPAADQPRENRPVRLSGMVLQGKAIERKIPEYPVPAKQIRLEGTVVVEVVISPDGRVEAAHAISGHPLFVKAATDAAWGWRFQPTLLSGTPVSVTGVITFVFKL